MAALMRASFVRLSLATALIWPATALAEASAWVNGLHSRVQLVAAAGGAQPARLAGLVIRLDPGFKTYWRHPGESGLPPAFDWSGSTNVAGVEVLWPAPARLADPDGVSYGYRDGVVLPLRVTPRDAGAPVRLALKLDYGVCRDICIPARAELAVKLPLGAPGRSDVDAALARVPAQQPLGAPGKLSIVAIEPITADAKPMLRVDVRAPAGEKPDLFVEAPDPWFLAAAGDMAPAAGTAIPSGATGSFLVEIAERPKDSAGPLDLRLTLVSADRAIETAATLDSGRLPR